jgi:hypothetical protein
MREPDASFLLLLHDRRVGRDIGSIDRNFPRWMVAGRALPNVVFRLRLFRDGDLRCSNAWSYAGHATTGRKRTERWPLTCN